MNERGEYGNRDVNGRGGYGAYGLPAPVLGRELTDAEMRDAQAAGDRAAQPLTDARLKMMRDWKPDAALSSAQMTQIIDNALKVARETEKNLAAMIDKVPSHWESILRNERNIINSELGHASRFQDLAAKATAPTVVPGFRDWIRRLLRFSEDGVTAIGYVAHVLPNWLRMVNIVSSIYSGAVAAIHGIVKIASALGGAAVETAKALPAFVKWLGIGAVAVGGIWAISKVRTSAKSAAS